MGQTYSLRPWGVGEENGNVDNLSEETDAIDGDNEDTVGMNEGHAVKHPHGAIENRG